MKNFFLVALLGALSFVSCDKDENIKNLPNEIKSFITEKYPNSRIVEFDLERTNIEVDIIHDNLQKDLSFSKSNVWISTSWDVLVTSLPKEVTAAIALEYPNMLIDDADYYQMPSGNFYSIELEPGDIPVLVKTDGTFLPLKPKK